MKTKRIAEVDVNLDAFAAVKSATELKKETGRIFGHLSSAEESAAYDELGAALGLPVKAVASNQPTATN